MQETPQPKFKKSSLTPKTVGSKKRMWKSLKQLLTSERNLQWKDAVTYSSINPPPSFRPVKKYSDVSGLIALYTDPQTKLNYHNAEEFTTVRSLPMDLTSGYLALRGATSIVG
ncbi:INO80 complex subunit C [Phlebotomus argentipes]|uniref:INO80 complex subunit C n=1 Tax=Phlebotomus argentipes TaxID=94469 RepID=UPI002892D38F|nr:INO80 complex subunit C [Phlebotomus argentipes]